MDAVSITAVAVWCAPYWLGATNAHVISAGRTL